MSRPSKRQARLDQLVFKFLDDAYVPAGLLSFEGAGPTRVGRFAYARTYLARTDKRAVDPIGLPLRGKSTPANPEEVHLAFHDSGPDGWGKSVLMRAFPHTQLSMPEFLALGSDRRTGDLAYGQTPDTPGPWRPAEDPLLDLPDAGDDVEALLAAARSVEDGEQSRSHLSLLVRASSDLGGARPKARLHFEGGDWIAKFPTAADTFDEPKIEAACLDVAEAAGIETPRRRILTVAGRSVLLVARFDRNTMGRPLGYLSAGTLLRAPSTRYGTTQTYADIADVGRRIGCPDMPREMFRRFLLNAALRNTDDHLRNHAFLEEGGAWRLSPVFDVVPQLGGRRHVCAPGPGFSPAWTPDAACKAFSGFGLTAGEADPICAAVAAAVARFGSFMDERGTAAGDRARVIDALRRTGRLGPR